MMADDFGYYAPRTPEDSLARYITTNASFDLCATVLDDVKNLNGGDGQLLRLCAEHNAYQLARELYLRGADLHLASENLLASFAAASKSSRMGLVPKDKDSDKEHLHLKDSYYRLEKWRKVFTEELAPQITVQRMQAMERKIDGLQAALAELAAQRTAVITIGKPDKPQP